MPNKLLILVQGPQSARYWLSRLSEVPSHAQWITYDVRSKAILEEAHLAPVDENYYYGSDRTELESIDRQVETLSRSWFSGLPLSEDVQAENFFIRTLHFTFLVILRAFHLLDRIQEVEGPCELWTTLTKGEDDAGLIRWSHEESPAAILLRDIPRWAFKTRFELVPAGLPEKRNLFRIPSFFQVLYRLLYARSKSSLHLFSGNPSLLGPIQASLEKQGARSCSIRSVTRVKDVARLFDPRSVFLSCAISGVGKRDARKIHEQLRKTKVFVYKGADLLPVFWHKIKKLYAAEIPTVASYYVEARKLFRKLQPVSLTVDEDVTEYQRALIVAAKAEGVRTTVMIHGLPGAPFGFVPLEADKILVWGSYSSAILKQWGVSEDKILITGSPKYDGLCRLGFDPVQEKDKLCNRLRLDARKPLVLVIPGGIRTNALEIMEMERNSSMEEIVKVARYFVRIAQENPDLSFVFKFRLVDPSELNLFKKMSSRLETPSNFVFLGDGLALDFIPGADLVFNHFSSAGLEAVILKKPVVQMNFSEIPDAYPFAEAGLGASVHTFEEASVLCRQLESGQLPLQDWIKSQEKIITPFVFSRDGLSAGRAADWVMNQSPKIVPRSFAGIR